FRVRIDGLLRYIKVGTHPDLSLEGARIRARKLRQRIADGENPADDRDRRRAEPTLEEVWKEYRARHKKRPTTLADDLRRWNRHVEKWSGRKASQIGGEDAVRLVRRVARDSGPYEANRLLALLRHLYRWARDEK